MRDADEAALVDEVFAHAAEFDAMTPEARVQEYRRREQADPEAARLWALFHTMRGMRHD